MARATVSVSGPTPPVDPSHEPRPGLRLGRYELLQRIASGGMAEVWAARQTGDFGFSRTCALKMIRPELAGSSTFRSMFLDEARLAARIRHPHVVEVFDLGEAGPVVYLAMELVEGDSLAGLLRDQEKGPPLSCGMIARIVSDMASGLHAAHELTDESGASLQLVHRDISPQNILVSLAGVAKIADFGVAKALGRLADETEAGQLKGKFSYLSPEQAGRRGVDRRSDVFAAGIVLWESLTRKRLFRGIDAIDTVSRVLSADVPDPCEYAPELPRALAKVTMKALERDPKRRYQTAAELSEAIEDAAQSAGVSISSRQLGAAISTRIGERAAEQRRAIAAAASDQTLATGIPMTHWPEMAPKRRFRPFEVVLGGSLVLAIGIVADYGLRTREPLRSAVDVQAAAARAPAAVDVPPPAAPSTSTAAVALPALDRPADDVGSVPPAASSAPSYRTAGPTRRAPAARSTPRPSTPSPKLPFGNPY